MKETREYIYLLRHMSSVLRERKSGIQITPYQREQCEQGIIALDKAVEALQVQVYA